ncbi:asparagine-tRNA ligase [Candidozyma auris]|nr:asparagine-tRNA ligase [[Candida] auris]QEL61063.1 asparagine-tRNA ligase [[Candida] auris]
MRFLPTAARLGHSLNTRCIQNFAYSTLAPPIVETLQNPPPSNSLITVNGHIKSLRYSKNVGFIDISDGSSSKTLNVVFSFPDKVLERNRFKVGQSLSVTGRWIESRGKQAYEVQYNLDNPEHQIKIMGDVPEDYPIQKKTHSLQFLRTLPTLRHRTSTLASILRFRSKVESHLTDFFNDNHFVKVTPPLITSSDCEGAGEQFQVESLKKMSSKGDEFFGKPANLTVSTQLHLEVLAQSLNRVWTLTPCFRAEDSNTNRHLSEFWMLEVEVCYIDRLQQLTALTEAMVRHVVKAMRSDKASFFDLTEARFNKDEAARINERWETVLSPEAWPSMTYSEAVEIINKVKCKGRSKGRMEWGDSISTEQEKWLAGEYFKSPVFVTDYPAEQKPFYMPPSSEGVLVSGKPTVSCFDLIMPDIGELVGGSMRQSDHNKLLEEMKRRDMNTAEIDWYLSTRLNGSVPHGGFGMGFERLIAYLGAMENIKDVTAFPRASGLCEC